eukprot:m.120052 g.120052  ORF g.120052 m.120052 type:complete len:865 (+) comp13335_c0_seq2:121-2715(+)
MAKVTLTGVLEWVKTHTLDFEELVVQEASQTAINRWLATRGPQQQSESPAPRTTPRVSHVQAAVKSCPVAMPRQVPVEVDPKILNRVSRLVGRRAEASIATTPEALTISERVADLSQQEHNKRLQFLTIDVCGALDLRDLCTKICRDVPLILKADNCTVSLRHVNHTAFTVFTPTECTENVSDEVAEHVLSSGCTVQGTGLSPNPDNETDTLATKLGMGAILAMPITGLDGVCMGVIRVAQNIPSAGGTDCVRFSEEDVRQLEDFTPFCAVAIQNAEIFATALLECKWSNVLLDLSKNLFENLQSKDSLISKIMVNAAALLTCERCSVFMIDFATKELFSKLFDATPDASSEDPENGAKEIRFPMDRGIAGHVATTGETLNIPDAYADPRFNQNIDKQTGFVTKTILCMPIKNVDGEVIGVAQLVNSTNGMFTDRDEKLFEAFAIYCGLSITAAALYEETSLANAKHCVALDILSYHATATDADTKRLAQLKVPTADVLGINSMSFDIKTLLGDEKIVACVRMFVDTGMVTLFRLPYLTLCRWLLSVEKNYRDVTYHNWDHAFNVTQTMYHILKKEDVQRLLDPYERLALLISCLCHDLDHRGTNNSFEDLKKSKLHTLYGTSTMECHHFNMCMTILESTHNNILVNLGVEQYKNVVSHIRKAILATDISTYLKTRGQYHKLVETKTFSSGKENDRALLRSMLMTASDLSAVVRPWAIQKRVAEAVYSEFFQQGSAERQIGHEPADLFNENKAGNLPKMQIGFLDFICKPVYTTLALHFSSLDEFEKALVQNREKWEETMAAGPYEMQRRVKPNQATPEQTDTALWLRNVEHGEGSRTSSCNAKRPLSKPSVTKRDPSKACAIL